MKINIYTYTVSLIAAIALSALTSCADPKDESHTDTKAINVKVATPIMPSEQGYFSASGQIEADQYANISTRMMGYISKIHVKVGDEVRKGQALININNADIEARKAQANAGFNQAQASYAIAKKDYNRFKELYAQNSASQKELDDISTQYEIAKAQVENARQMQNEIDAMLSYINIKAPFHGIVTSKSVKEGDMAKPGQVLLSLEKPGMFVATALVSETDITYVHRSDTVKVFLKSNGTSMKGIVSEVSTSSQESGGQYLVKIQLISIPDANIYSGMFVSTIFPVDHKTNNRILIPKEVLVKKGELEGIYTVSSSNTAILRWLKLGRSLGDNIEVLSGMKEGEQYIVSSDGKLFNGVKLNIN